MWTVIRIASSNFGFAHRRVPDPPVTAPLLRERLSMLIGEVFFNEAVREVLDWLGDFSYHFLGRCGFKIGSGEYPRPLDSSETLDCRECP
jgi:hypothetical protein